MDSVGKELPFINEKKKQKKSSYHNSGLLLIVTCGSIQTPTFLDYLKGGCELGFVVAIDFTSSNVIPFSFLCFVLFRFFFFSFENQQIQFKL
jgi:hypothetical protein